MREKHTAPFYHDGLGTGTSQEVGQTRNANMVTWQNEDTVKTSLLVRGATCFSPVEMSVNEGSVQLVRRSRFSN